MKKIFSVLTVILFICSGCTSGEKEFDFDESVKKFTLFQREFSLPYEVEELGDDFSIDEPSDWIVFGDVTTSGFYYLGQNIGTVTIIHNGEHEEIISFDLGFIVHNNDLDEELRKAVFESYGWYSEEIELDFNGLGFNSSADEIKSCLGTPNETTDEYFKDYLVYEFPNGYIWVKFYQASITQFCIGVK